MIPIVYAATEADIAACTGVILELRPHLQEAGILPRIQEMQREGYEIVYIAAPDNPGRAAAFAGYRHMQTLYGGKTIYIDDLATLPGYRGRGYAAALLQHLHNLAKAEQLDSVQLDSGHARTTAHRLYLNQGYIITAHHFVHQL